MTAKLDGMAIRLMTAKAEGGAVRIGIWIDRALLLTGGGSMLRGLAYGRFTLPGHTI
ncbi:MAG: hypothetical protein WB902_19235 [Acetobacteraceae bacterium]